MLKGPKKKMVRDAIRYYIDTTGLTSDNFILDVSHNSTKRGYDSLDYHAWLAVKIFKLFQQNDITLADCLEFRNLATQLKLEKRGMNVTTLWKKLFGKCIALTDISRYELFELSDANSELNYVESDKEVIFCGNDKEDNFFNLFDFDEHNKFFYDNLPKKLQQAIEYKLPIFINMNPYLEHKTCLDRLYDQMVANGYSNKLILNPFYGCIYKLLYLCSEYDLNEVRIGFFSPVDMFNEKEEYNQFYMKFKSKFKFNRGVCFSPKSVGVNSKEEFIAYSIWDLKRENSEKSDNAVVLNTCVQHTDDTILEGAGRLFRGQKESLYDWEVNSIKTSGISSIVPKYSSIQTPSGETIKRFSNVLGYQANTKNLLRSYKRVGVYSVPVGDCTEITIENFYKSVASYTVRSCVGQDIDIPKRLNAPDVMVDGYQKWLADAVIYFLFSPNNMTKSYREKDLVLSNRLFPLKLTDVKNIIRDKNILDDIESRGADNLIITQVIDSLFNDLTKPALELFSFCKQKIIESLTGKIRENYGYKDSLVAWDASFYQIRRIESVFTEEEEKMYSYLFSKLQERLNDGVYKYGFISS